MRFFWPKFLDKASFMSNAHPSKGRITLSVVRGAVVKTKSYITIDDVAHRVGYGAQG